MIYGYVQQRRMVEGKVQLERTKQQVDSLKTVVEKLNNDLMK